MKIYTIIITVLFICLCLLGISGLIESRKKSELDQKEINHLKKRNKEQTDSLNTVLAVTRDSLNVAFETIRQANTESQKAHERTQQLIKNYEKIIFVSFSNDAQRDSALSKLYPSFRPIR